MSKYNYTQISIGIQSSWCNEWPKFRVIGNDKIYFDDYVKDYQTIKVDLPTQNNNSLVLEHYGKYFGENKRWDTKSENGKIVQDRAVKVCQLEFNDVDIKKHLYDNFLFQTNGQSIKTDYYGNNGRCIINFEAPVYNWIITTLLREPMSSHRAPDLVLETSHSDLFNYESDTKQLKELEHLLKQHEHLFN